MRETVWEGDGEIEEEFWGVQRRWRKVTTPPPFPFDVKKNQKKKSNAT